MAAKGTLRSRMMERLEAARFRQINEDLDSAKDSNPQEAFNSNKELFEKYHSAYKQRIQQWPTDPLNLIIKFIKKKFPADRVIADFGCGEARLSTAVPNTVHSFDVFALNDRVTACDMSNTPLENDSVDLAVFCLSLMGTDVSKYIAEANRVVKKKGILKIAEVASRFADSNASTFIKRMKKFGFASKEKIHESNKSVKKSGKTGKDVVKKKGEVFLMLEFRKFRSVKYQDGRLPPLKLTPCTYKKR